jgi:hypothetical protein
MAYIPTKNKLRQSKKAYSPYRGHLTHHTQDAKEKIAGALRGRPLSEAHKETLRAAWKKKLGKEITE